MAAVALGVHLFVMFYEEPTLRRKFGADYEEYRRNVRRWWPRLRPGISTLVRWSHAGEPGAPFLASFAKSGLFTAQRR